ncbi:hypothetical protein NKH72_22470 [Mesorhizobium sp. M0955]|uniref:hypothetical protein n=1 Tax=Mesorhizobium sp. M0955 TaxID=2957033 RepID=UPI00333B4A74
MRNPLAFLRSLFGDDVGVSPSRRRLDLNAGRELKISRKQAVAFLADPNAFLNGKPL